jgi:DNA-binding cell septation regulator SpoVG
MNITKVQIKLNRGTTSKAKAWADIIFDDEFIVKGLAIRENAQGEHYITMPYKVREENHDQIRQDMAHPIRENCRKYIEERVLDEYEDVLNKIQDNNRNIQDHS